MKCNKCKKIIPQGEELFINSPFLSNYGWYHEECVKKLEDENKKFLFGFLITIFILLFFLISLALLLKNK